MIRFRPLGLRCGTRERSRYEMGGYLKLNFKKDFSEEISYAVRLDLFSNFLDNPQNIDVYSDHVLLLKVNPWLSRPFLRH